MLKSFIKTSFWFLSLVFLFSCQEVKKESNIFWLSNGKFLNFENGILSMSENQDTIITENSILKTNDGEYHFVLTESGYYYILDKNLSALTFEDEIKTESFDVKKIKFKYLAETYNLNEHKKKTLEFREYFLAADSVSYANMVQKSSANNISIDEQIKGDVDWATKKYGLINFTESRVYYYINKFISDKKMNSFIVDKAKSKNQPINSAILGDSQWLVSKEKQMK